MPDPEKLRERLRRQVARDDTNRRHWAERRRRRIAQGMDDPVLPAFNRLCLIGMIAGSVMMATGDLAVGAPRNASRSALWCWLAFGVPLAIGCALQLHRGFDHPWFAQHRLDRRGRPRMPWARKYRFWLAAAVTGAAVLAVLCLAARGPV